MSSQRIPALLERLNSLENPTPEIINDAIEEFHSERLPEDGPSSISGSRRKAVDIAFSGDSVEDIMAALEEIGRDAGHPESEWAQRMLSELDLRSPTSLRIALENLKRGKQMTVGEALTMELGVATAFCVSWRASLLSTSSFCFRFFVSGHVTDLDFGFTSALIRPAQVQTL